MMFTLLLQIFASAAAVAATAAVLYIVTANRNVPVSSEEATLLWKIHKQTSRCSGHKMQAQVGKHGKITCFQCECGYYYAQKKPLLSRRPQTTVASPMHVKPIQSDASFSSVQAKSSRTLK